MCIVVIGVGSQVCHVLDYASPICSVFFFRFELGVPVYWFVVKFGVFVWCVRVVHDLFCS